MVKRCGSVIAICITLLALPVHATEPRVCIGAETPDRVVALTWVVEPDEQLVYAQQIQVQFGCVSSVSFIDGKTGYVNVEPDRVGCHYVEAVLSSGRVVRSFAHQACHNMFIPMVDTP